jgi:hypothetical protein
MKYKLEMYGWSVEAMGHSLNDSQVKSIQDLMESNGYSELWEVRKIILTMKLDLMRSIICHKMYGFSSKNPYSKYLIQNNI